MSFRYRVLEHCIRAVDIKKIYSMPEEEMLEYIVKNHRANDLPDFLYKHLNVEKIDIGKKPLFKIQPKNHTASNVILFIHGGGGMMSPTLLHYRFAEKLVKRTGAVLYFPFYPLGPEGLINEAMLHLDEVYREILKHHEPEDITIIGDSAGAALSVSVCAGTEIKPKGIVLISPSVGIDKDDGEMKALEDKDVILSVRTLELVKKYWIGNNSDLRDDFNTLRTDYSSFPPIQLYYGTNEIFYAYINELIDKIKTDGAELMPVEGKGLCHDWALIGIIPEGSAAINNICGFVKSK